MKTVKMKGKEKKKTDQQLIHVELELLRISLSWEKFEVNALTSNFINQVLDFIVYFKAYLQIFESNTPFLWPIAWWSAVFNNKEALHFLSSSIEEFFLLKWFGTVHRIYSI